MRDLGKSGEHWVLSTTLDTAVIVEAIHPPQLTRWPSTQELRSYKKKPYRELSDEQPAYT